MAKRGSANWRKAISRGKRRTRATDPIGWAEKFERMVNTRRERGSLGLVKRAGNGHGPSRAQSLLYGLIGGELEYIIPLGKVGWKKGWPCCYSLDIGFAKQKVGVDLDGESHRNPKSRRIDSLKMRRLKRMGWKVLRFWNREVFDNPDRVVALIKAALSK